jgi:hypothetical protein
MVGIIGWTVFKITKGILEWQNNRSLQNVLTETINFNETSTTPSSASYDRYKNIFTKKISTTNSAKINDEIQNYLLKKLARADSYFAVELLIHMLREGDDATKKAIKKLLNEDLGHAYRKCLQQT